MVPEDRKVKATPNRTADGGAASTGGTGGIGGSSGFFYGFASRVVSSVATVIDAVDQSLTSPPPPTSASDAVHRRRRAGGDDAARRRPSSLLVPRTGRLARIAAGEVSGDESADEYVLVPSASSESLASQASFASSLKEPSSGSDADDELVLVSANTAKDVFSDDDTMFFEDSDLETASTTKRKTSPRTSLSPHGAPLTQQNVKKLQKSTTGVSDTVSHASSSSSSPPSLASTPDATTAAASDGGGSGVAPTTSSAAGTGLQVCENADLDSGVDTDNANSGQEEGGVAAASAAERSHDDDGAAEATSSSSSQSSPSPPQRHDDREDGHAGEEDGDADREEDEDEEESREEPRQDEGMSTGDLFSGVSSFFSTSFHGLQKVASTVTDVAEHALDSAVDASSGLYADGVALTGEIMNETVAVGRTIVSSSLDTIEDVLDTIVAPANNQPPAVKTREQILQQLSLAGREAGESGETLESLAAEAATVVTPSQANNAIGTGVTVADLADDEAATTAAVQLP